MNTSAKTHYIKCHFEEIEKALGRAKELTESNKFHLEGITVLVCHIAAIARERYPDCKDWKSFKNIVRYYSGKYELYENIDLLLLYQFPHSKLADDKNYKKLANYDEIVSILEQAIGTEENIRTDSSRYQKREDLLQLLQSKNILGFDESNFSQYIELFSNNQILYDFARCEAVHNNDFPLINIGVTFPDMQRTFTPNHQITPEVIIETLTGITANLKEECLENKKWPREL
jgi:hypothetical protein